MALIYKNCLPTAENPTYSCDPCFEGEKGRVSGIVLFDKSLKSELKEEKLTDMGWWGTQLLAGKARIIPLVRGTYDGGTNKTVTGFGRLAEKIVGKTHVLVWNDKNHTANEPFYTYLESNLRNFIPGWVTENELRVGGNVLEKLEVKDAVEEDVESLVLWQATATWTQSFPNIPKIIDLKDREDIKGLFENCVDLSEVVAVPSNVKITKFITGYSQEDLLSIVDNGSSYSLYGSGLTISGSDPSTGLYFVSLDGKNTCKCSAYIDESDPEDSGKFTDTSITNFMINSEIEAYEGSILDPNIKGDNEDSFKFRLVSQHNPNGEDFKTPWVYEWDRIIRVENER
ncbi:hypothetical protein [Limibacterium fermenti]|uniref:hypothetical protein n=1 Tax=Limibacterium fermenti TaxID=3229863 RepID=UPI003A5DAFD4